MECTAKKNRTYFPLDCFSEAARVRGNPDDGTILGQETIQEMVGGGYIQPGPVCWFGNVFLPIPESSFFGLVKKKLASTTKQ